MEVKDVFARFADGELDAEEIEVFQRLHFGVLLHIIPEGAQLLHIHCLTHIATVIFLLAKRHSHDYLSYLGYLGYNATAVLWPMPSRYHEYMCLSSATIVKPPPIRDEIQTPSWAQSHHAKINQLHLDVFELVLRRFRHVEEESLSCGSPEKA
ncbi:MAG: hypothetical protein ACFHHU_01595 [Porticoccaceae bacterium]